MIDENTDLEAAQRELRQEQARLNERAAEIKAERIRRDEIKHSELCAQCRAAQDEVKRLTELADQCYRKAFRLRSVAESAKRLHEAWLSRRPTGYPTRKEIADWEQELENRAAELKEANDAAGVANGEHAAARDAKRLAQEKFNRLVEQEESFRIGLTRDRPQEPILATLITGVQGATIDILTR